MRLILALLPLLIAGSPAFAQADTTGCTIPDGTPMRIVVAAPVSSKVVKIGDPFPIVLGQDLFVDGKLLLPAGLEGTGEVIHASKAKLLTGGHGELILAARYLLLGETRISLRGFRINDSVMDYEWLRANQGKVSVLPRGLNAEVPAGASAQAKAAGAVTVPCPAA